MSRLTTKNVIKYALLPGIIPRVFDFFNGMFAHTAFLVALIFAGARLLPPDHPYLNPQNFGRFGLRHVISQAADRLVFTKDKIDQILIFVLILTGLVLLLSQFILMILAFVSSQALASGGTVTPLNFTNLFTVASAFKPPEDYPAQDITFILLDKVFGMKGIFNSCVSLGIPCLRLDGGVLNTGVAGVQYPTPFHNALHGMLEFYSRGIFIVSVMVILYFVIVVTAETAQSGTPFGQRFNKTWVPIRLILFFALLVPLHVNESTSQVSRSNNGLNMAQYIVLLSAKYGSSFATNAWGFFNMKLTCAYSSSPSCGTSILDADTSTPIDNNSLLASPNIPNLDLLMQFIYAARVCKTAEEVQYNYSHWTRGQGGIQPYLTRLTPPQQNGAAPSGPDHILLSNTSYQQALAFTNNKTITITFGTYHPASKRAKNYNANVIPYCGSLTLPVTKIDPQHAGSTSVAAQITEFYYNLVKTIWNDPQIYNNADCFVKKRHPLTQDLNCSEVSDIDFVTQTKARYDQQNRDQLRQLIANGLATNETISKALHSKGWAGGALWYNRIAELNGEVANVIQNTPKPLSYALVLETIKNVRSGRNEFSDLRSIFDPLLPDDQKINFRREGDDQLAPIMFSAMELWGKVSDGNNDVIINVMNALFGTSAIFDMRANADVHPLAQLSSLGKSLMEASIRNIAIGLPTEMVLKSSSGFVGILAKTAGTFLKTVGSTTLAMSFVMYYVLPFMPFIYFIFAVGGWLKSIFEAMVAMPLWALAHISKIEGDGFMGPASKNGYALIFEIFLRPILILFGLVASISIFSALVSVLNNGVFDLVVQNLTGFNQTQPGPGSTTPLQVEFYRNSIDQFFFTVLYVIFVYVIGLSCFKLIDQIPNQILRWMGVSVKTIQESGGSPANQVLGKTYFGANLATGQINGGNLAAFL